MGRSGLKVVTVPNRCETNGLGRADGSCPQVWDNAGSWDNTGSWDGYNCWDDVDLQELGVGTVPVVSQLHLGRSQLPARPQLTCDGSNSTWDVRNFQHVPTHLGRSLQCPNCTWYGRDLHHFPTHVGRGQGVPTPLETCSVPTPLGSVATS